MYGSTHAVIGDYSELNPKDCGITRLTKGFDDMCYKWHNKSLPSMTAGKKATKNEVPWMMAVEFLGSYVLNGKIRRYSR